MTDSVTAKEVYATLATEVGPCFIARGFERARKPANMWRRLEPDPEFDAAIAEMDQVNPEDWQ